MLVHIVIIDLADAKPYQYSFDSSSIGKPATKVTEITANTNTKATYFTSLAGFVTIKLDVSLILQDLCLPYSLRFTFATTKAL